MDNGNSAAHQVREAAERIRQEQQAWQGVGLMAVENLETGACGVVLVPADVPRPDWSEELRYGAPGWDQGEDVALAAWLSRWYAGMDTPSTANWQKLENLLNLHCPAALVSSMPEPGRRLRVRHGLGVHALPAAEDRPGLLARLVAWAARWEGLALPDGTRACASWLNPSNVLRTWPPVAAAMGARGRTREERLTAGGMHEWGLLIAWPSVVDLVVAFLLAQADAMEQPASTVRAGAVSGKRWEDVQAELLAIMQRDRPSDKPCPSFRELGKALNCSHRTVGKAFKAHVGLTAWRKETGAGAARTTPAAAQVLPADADEAVRALVREQAADFESSPLERGSNPRVRKQA